MQDLDAILAGDEEAWNRLVQETTPLLRGLAGRTFSKYGFSADQATCEDIASQVWINLLAQDRKLLHTCRDQQAWTPMLHTLVRNRCIDHMRKTRTVSLPDEEHLKETGHTPSPAPGLQKEWIHGHLNRLTDRERSLIELFFLQDLSYKDIERATGIPSNSIGPTLKRALKRLREQIEQEESA